MSELYDKILAEAAQDRKRGAKPRSARLPSRAVDRVSAAPVVPGPDELRDAPLDGLAVIIDRDWGPVNYAARPYLDAMHALETVDDYYGQDRGYGIVRYFLSNASTWRGPVARAVKAELRRRVGLK